MRCEPQVFESEEETRFSFPGKYLAIIHVFKYSSQKFEQIPQLFILNPAEIHAR